MARERSGSNAEPANQVAMAETDSTYSKFIGLFRLLARLHYFVTTSKNYDLVVVVLNTGSEES